MRQFFILGSRLSALSSLIFLGSLLSVLSSCYRGKSCDLIIHNAVIHTMDQEGSEKEAMAIKDGKIIETGPERQILNKYSSEETIDAAGKEVYPGLTDAHGHILSYANQLLSADLVGSKSFDEVIVRVEKYQSRKQRQFVIGRGWDQSLWPSNEFPTNERLNELFPTIPVCLIRIDGHALLANDALLKLANITPTTKIDGGIIHVEGDKCTGLLVDNAMNPIYQLLPEFPKKERIEAIGEIQAELLQYGITGVHEAGIERKDIDLFKELIDKYDFSLNLYAMLMPSEDNIAFAKKNRIYQYKNLSIRSFKVMGDGALGSRGALLKAPYTDQHNHFGVLTTSEKEMNRIATICELTGYQMNTHAIGDSTNKILLNLYQRIFKVNPDHRWRIEHAQVVDPNDFELFSKYGVFPSVQPTHAVSDQRWAEQRIGRTRMMGAYAYKTLLTQNGMIAIGTDFPIELTDPFLTIHAAVNRQNSENMPTAGFYPKEKITLDECLRGMTIWAAFASFQENELGTIEKGKDATFAIFERPIRAEGNYQPNFALHTFIKGKKVYTVD
jgi:predicted amidohydrolase YtcJ